MLSRSKPRLAWNQARQTGVILASHDTLQELASVLCRPKLAAYISLSESTVFLAELAHAVELVPITEPIPATTSFLSLRSPDRPTSC